MSPANQALIGTIKKNVGKVPNGLAAMVNSEQGLATYFALTTAKSPLQAKEKEVINLVVSQVNTCDYCLAAHTVLSKMNGFNDEQVVTNYLYSMSDIKLDFPAAPVLDAQTA